MNNKMTAMLFLALLVASLVPATVVAKSGLDVEVEYRDDSGNEVEVRERVRVRDGEIRSEVRERVRDARGDVIETRERGRERADDHRERVSEARERLQDNRESFKEVRVEMRAVCAGNGSGEECVEARTELRLRTQSFLGSTGERLLVHLERLQSFVDERIDDEAASARFTSEIETQREDVQALMDSLPQEPTKEELRENAQDLKEEWQEIKVLTRDIQQATVKVKVDAASQRMENLASTLRGMRDGLEDAGADVSELDLLLAEFEAELELSANATTAQEAREHFSSAVHLLREIMHEIRDARAEVRGEVRLGIESSGNVELSEQALQTLNELKGTFEGLEGEYKLSLEVNKEGNETVVDAETEGNLTEEQESLWEEFQEQARELVAASENPDAEFEIEFEHELEVESSNVEAQENATVEA